MQHSLLMGATAISRNRVNSIDFLRGIVMVIMALDHTRDFFHYDAFLHDPVNPATTSPELYFTRWITHFCAPVFVFLAGLSAYLMGQKKTKKELSLFLIRRGCWLIFIEVVIINFAFTFDPAFTVITLQVIWAIGISMIILGLLVRLPYRWIAVLACAIVFGHNLLDYSEVHQRHFSFWWDLLHKGGFTAFHTYSGHHMLLIAYAFVPWTGIMLTGYCMGKLFEPSMQPAKRKKILLLAGIGLICLFFVLRWINVYGDPVPWSHQRSVGRTFLSFMNVNKYPPSLLYSSIMLGPALIFLALAEPVHNRIASFFIVYGRVPFFYYVIHFFLIHIGAVIAFYATGHGAADIVSHSPMFFRPVNFGFRLRAVYLVWITVVLVLYPLCRWYSRYKATHRQWWLSYL